MIKKILKALLFGGLGTFVIGVVTSQWLMGLILCMTISFFSTFILNKKDK